MAGKDLKLFRPSVGNQCFQSCSESSLTRVHRDLDDFFWFLIRKTTCILWLEYEEKNIMHSARKSLPMMILQSTSSSLTIPGKKATVCLPFASLKCLTHPCRSSKRASQMTCKQGWGDILTMRVCAFMVLYLYGGGWKAHLKNMVVKLDHLAARDPGVNIKNHIWVATTLVSIPNPNWASSNSYNSYNMLQPSPTQGKTSPTIPIIPSIPSLNTGVINITNLNFMAILFLGKPIPQTLP